MLHLIQWLYLVDIIFAFILLLCCVWWMIFCCKCLQYNIYFCQIRLFDSQVKEAVMCAISVLLTLQMFWRNCRPCSKHHAVFSIGNWPFAVSCHAAQKSFTVSDWQRHYSRANQYKAWSSIRWYSHLCQTSYHPEQSTVTSYSINVFVFIFVNVTWHLKNFSVLPILYI